MANVTSSRKPVIAMLRITAAIVMTLAVAGVAGAETFIMPTRDGIRNEPIVLWGATLLPNHNTPAGTTTTYRILSYDGTTTTVLASGNVTDRTYINVTHTYAVAGTYLVTLEVTRGAGPAETASREVRIVDPALLPGPGLKTLPVGPSSNEQYRNLRINMAIEDGLRYLWFTQFNRTGAGVFDALTTSWGNQPYWTAMVVTAFENHGYRLANDGSAATGIYERFIVQRGLNFVINHLQAQTLVSAVTAAAAGQPVPRDPCVGEGIENNPAATPPGARTCTGYTETAESPGYAVGISMMALAASNALDRVHTAGGIAQNKKYREILQRLSNSLAWGQYDGNNGSALTSRGGWGYGLQNGTQDGSVMGWAYLGVLDARAAGIVVPDWVITEAVFSINNGLNNNGSWDYNPNGPAAQGNYTGMHKGGIPLQGMFLTGETTGPRVDLVLDYISDRWNAVGPVAPDTQTLACGTHKNFGCGYSMFNNFKGLQLLNVPTLPGVARPAGPGAIVANDWLASYEDWLVNNQVPGPAPNGGGWVGRTTPAPAIPAMRLSPHSPTPTDAPGNAAIAELILSGVALVLPDGEKFAKVGLTPPLTTLVESNTVTVTAKAESTNGAPVPGATVNFSIISGPNAGLFAGTDVTDADGQATFTYTDPGPLGTFGTDAIQANIGTLLSNIVEVVWAPFNRPPVANPDNFIVNEDGVLSGNVLANDTDPDAGDVITAALVTGPAHGTLTLNVNGSFTYTPLPNYCGPDAFTYDVNDGDVDGNIAAVAIDVICVNDAPVANPETFTIAEDSVLAGENVLINDADVDAGEVLSAVLVTGPAHGALVLNANGAFTYTPTANYCGPDGFTYAATDGEAQSNVAPVTINVTCVNDAPFAVPDSFTVAEDAILTGGNVLANDADADAGDTLSAVLVTGPAHGALVLNANGAFTYTPLPNYCGPDGFTYRVKDGEVDGNVASVTIDVTCVNDAPVAVPDSFTVAEDAILTGGNVLANDADADAGDTLSAVLVAGPAHGTLVLNSDGTFTYTPVPNYCGADAFTYRANDGQVDGNVAAVAIDVTCANDAPVANDSAVTTAEDTPSTGAVTSADVDGPSATYAVVTAPSHGTLVLDPATGAYTYTPALNYNGPDSFTFSVDDGAGGTDTGVVSITVTPVNDAPVCTAAGPSVASLWPADHSLVSITVLGVVDPVEQSAITITIDSIFQDEPTNTVGDGNTLIDGYGVGTPVAQVRRERSGSKRVPGDGRMYYINFTGTDAEGGTCTGTVQVGVPHDMGQDHVIGAGGPLYNSTGQ